MRRNTLLDILKIISPMVNIGEIIARVARWEQLTAIEIPFRHFVLIILVAVSFVTFFIIIKKIVDLLLWIENDMLGFTVAFPIAAIAGSFLALMLTIDWQLVMGFSLQSEYYLVLYAITIPFAFICIVVWYKHS